MSSPERPILRMKSYSTPSVLARAYAVDNGMSAEPTRFSGANPPLPVLQAQIAKVEDAYKEAKARIKGAARICAFERSILVGMLHSECAYVWTLCLASPEQASLIIQSAGLVSATVRTYEQSPLKVTHGAVSGSVDLDAGVALLMGGRSRKGKFFSWQWTTDGGQSFHDAPSTSFGKTTIASLTPLATVGFRVKVTTGKDPGTWSAIVSIQIR